jgi:hypothetical protein
MQLSPPRPVSALSADSLIIDRELPRFDVRLAEHLLVDADVPTTWDALCRLDLLRVHTPLLDAAFWVRGLPAKVRRTEAPVPPSLVLGDAGTQMPGWLVLGVDPGHELALGAVGRFWTPSIVWHDVDRDEFATFDEPGWGKIAVSFSVRPYGEHRSLLTYECRTATHDAASARAFARYWVLIRGFVAHIMRATLRTAAAGVGAPPER